MATGKIKMFNTDKGYGFIIPDEGGDDVFVNLKEMKKSGITALEKGQAVSYDSKYNKDKMAATNIKVL